MKYISTEYADFLKGIYKQPNYLPSSGWALSRVKEAVKKIAETDMPLERKRAEMFAVTVRNMRFALDDDYFVDRFDYYKGLYGGSLLQEYRNGLLNSVIEEYPERELAKNCRQANLFWATHDFSHISPHWERLFALGVSGIIIEAEENKKKNALSEEQLKEIAGGIAKYKDNYESVVKQFEALGLKPPTREQFSAMFPGLE